MTSSQTRLRSSLDLFEVKSGKFFSTQVLKDMLTTIKAVLFFGKAYRLNYQELSNLMHLVVKTDLADALFAGDHSTALQDYLVHEVYEFAPPSVQEQTMSFAPVPDHGEILPEMWADLEVVVAKSIQTVADKLGDLIGHMPGKQGHMVFSSFMTMNAKRPTLGNYQAQVKHQHQAENLLILDVSGSMTASTIARIIKDVVALSWKADAHLAIVSNSCFYWKPGGYSVDEVLAKAEYSGTHYEMLAPLFDRSWGTVITVADYDSSASSKEYLKNNCSTHIDQVLDISLVNRPTYLAECVGQFADKVTPMLIAQSSYVLSN